MRPHARPARDTRGDMAKKIRVAADRGRRRISSSSRARTRAPRSGSTRRCAARRPTRRPAPTSSSSSRPNEWRRCAPSARAFDLPLVANMVEKGATPVLSKAELESIGYRLAIFPVTALLASAARHGRCLRAPRFHGLVEGRCDKAAARFRRAHDLVGFQDVRDFEKDHAEPQETGNDEIAFAHPCLLPSPLPRSRRATIRRPIRLVVPFAPGGVTDTGGRLIAERWRTPRPDGLRREQGRRLGQHRHARGCRGGARRLHARPRLRRHDGHQPARVREAPFDTVKDFAPVGKIGDAELILVAHPAFPQKTLKDIIETSKKEPKGISYGTSGIGGTPHIAGELLNLRTGSKLVHIPYKGGGQAMSDALGGNIPLVYTAVAGAHQYVKTRQARAVAVSSLSASARCPTCPRSSRAAWPVSRPVPGSVSSRPPRRRRPIVATAEPGTERRAGLPRGGRETSDARDRRDARRRRSLRRADQGGSREIRQGGEGRRHQGRVSVGNRHRVPPYTRHLRRAEYPHARRGDLPEDER